MSLYIDVNYIAVDAMYMYKMGLLWTSTILPQYEKEEKRFLIEHANNVIIPFILHHRITSQEIYQSFKSVIDAMPDKYR